MKTDRVIQNELKSKIKILIVEDNLLSRKLVGFMFTNWGYTFDECANGKLAIENIKLHKYDLILMDIQMPELNGYDTAKYIRKELKLGLPIIAMTSHSNPGERERCLLSGMNDYIAKPINEEELYNVVTNYLFTTVVLNQENKVKKNFIPEKKISPDFYLKKGLQMQDSTDDSKKIVNLDYLIEVSNGNTKFVKEMVKLFLTENPEEIKAMEKGIEEKNFEAIKIIAHKLRSTIPFIGLDKIIEKEVAEVETLATDKADFGKIKTLFSKIKKTCEMACYELQPVLQTI